MSPVVGVITEPLSEVAVEVAEEVEELEVAVGGAEEVEEQEVVAGGGCGGFHWKGRRM